MLSALVLAAGLGTRLDPLTRLVAKPAVPLGRRTLVEHVIAWLETQGVTDVVMNLHHLPSTITAVVGDGAHLGVNVRYSWEPQILGSAGGPRRALPLLHSDPFLIVNADTLCGLDIDGLVRGHQATGADVTLAVVPNHAPGRYNGIRAGADGEVLGFVPKGQAQDTWHFVGVQVAAKSVFRPLPDGAAADTVAGFYRDLVANEPGRIRIWPVAEAFLDVGTPSDYLTACLTTSRGSVDHPDMASPGRATVDLARQTVVWSSAEVPPSARLERAIVAGPVRLPPDFVARDSIVIPSLLLRPTDRAEVRGDVAVMPLSSQ